MHILSFSPNTIYHYAITSILKLYDCEVFFSITAQAEQSFNEETILWYRKYCIGILINNIYIYLVSGLWSLVTYSIPLFDNLSHKSLSNVISVRLTYSYANPYLVKCQNDHHNTILFCNQLKTDKEHGDKKRFKSSA